MINTAYLFQRIIVNSRYNFRAQRRIYPVLIRISILHRGTTRSVHSIRFTTSLCHVFIIVERATSHVLLQRPTQTMSLDMILQYNNNKKNNNNDDDNNNNITQHCTLQAHELLNSFPGNFQKINPTVRAAEYNN